MRGRVTCIHMRHRHYACGVSILCVCGRDPCGLDHNEPQKHSDHKNGLEMTGGRLPVLFVMSQVNCLRKSLMLCCQQIVGLRSGPWDAQAPLLTPE